VGVSTHPELDLGSAGAFCEEPVGARVQLRQEGNHQISHVLHLDVLVVVESRQGLVRVDLVAIVDLLARLAAHDARDVRAASVRKPAAQLANPRGE
jgi:hypothetical protein